MTFKQKDEKPEPVSQKRILRNAIKCNHCGEEIESVHRHDFRQCGCERVFVDGGRDYLRRGYGEESDYEELAVHEDEGN